MKLLSCESLVGHLLERVLDPLAAAVALDAEPLAGLVLDPAVQPAAAVSRMIRKWECLSLNGSSAAQIRYPAVLFGYRSQASLPHGL